MSVDDTHRKDFGRLVVPRRDMMGPGPSNYHPRVMSAMALPALGHLHPPTLKIMDEIKELLKYTFQTESDWTFAVSGTGHAAMECSIANLVEPGDVVLVGNNGIWGQRVMDIVGRYGGKAVQMEKAAGHTFSLDEIKNALAQHKPSLLFLTHGESSGGTMQNLRGVGEACREANCLLLADAVCTLGAAPLLVDQWCVDACYSGSQKALSCAPGVSPITFGPRAVAKLTNRKTPVQSWYFDANEIARYWGVEGRARFYHHTGPVSLFYALREALAVLAEERLEKAWARHQNAADLLYAELERVGLRCLVEKKDERLPSVTTIAAEGIDPTKILPWIMAKYEVEISAGLGPTAGKALRVGLMGVNANPKNVLFTVAALKDALETHGYGDKYLARPQAA
uniref:alanine--glyoxylate transaminase n=1 Tax=Chromera velia CCMP2878 TaxID=1169474 RepID=A0A0G4HNM7_9ALVE|eukprot:Cvel_7646.t1-p1 / transcript=Cvel_7646.t1 / gene=Cvel_7646 / organism=Chromera_velia_CCMP2878 / gene_product=Serine--pyruvate aminotransferase, mitochondrial, putative / transcript_product=Serine--pyruvate aminotransferase, mitochondrial, putative / location=Cvel_scaffold404:66856-70164(-) / protein_length=395 / sequence_SO=supercontig / SO=protein_coding / is_pseudo=false